MEKHSDRAFIPEKMDDFLSDRQKLERTLNQFRLINRLFTASLKIMKRCFYREMKKDASRSWRLLDIGAGGCDIPARFLRFCRKRGIDVKITCIDHDPRIIEYARKRTAGISGIEIVSCSVFDIEKLPEFDFIFSNHFLHHFKDKQIIQILNLLCAACKTRFVMNDLKRSRTAFILYRLFAFLFLHNSFAAWDGGVSISKGFLVPEMKKMVRSADCSRNIRVEELFPGRIMVIGEGTERKGDGT